MNTYQRIANRYGDRNILDIPDWLPDFLDNEFGAAFVCGIVLFVSGIFLPLWEFLFSATSSYVAFDAIMSLILHQGEGYIKIGLDNEFQSKGHGFFAFFFGIVFGTAGIDYCINLFIGMTKQAVSPWVIVFLGTFLATGDCACRSGI